LFLLIKIISLFLEYRWNKYNLAVEISVLCKHRYFRISS